jgi:hypothetical protein
MEQTLEKLSGQDVGPMKAKAERGQQQVVRSFDKIGAPITKK